jgi:hypothetical protein
VTRDLVEATLRPRISYSSPDLTRVLGCAPGANERTLVDCARAGGDTITLQGQNFGPDSAKIMVGADFCLNTTHNASSPHTELTCVVPRGFRQRLALVVIQAAGGPLLSSRWSQTARISALYART